ncbi:imelysin family protein [Aureivirga sp. CE67]|uniref:imelysin family protein n=1 Tax=Aureivirga sp. CE67 TaxID=1788983 RepID=UPI0018CAE308|nr:imelysin family protein [Aureivirga sp. CE67]
MIKKVLFLFVAVLAISCGSDDSGSDGNGADTFDRKVMLENWADNIIIPSYEDFQTKMNDLNSKTEVFVADGSAENLENLRTSWLNAYKAWQHVSMYEIGKSEELTFRNFMNIYPTSSTKIEQFVASGNYNLQLPSTFDAQGFPALDYLLYGISDAAVSYETVITDAHKDYLTAVVSRMKTLTDEVVADWETGFREAFVGNSGSTASSSVNVMVNKYVFYYEKFLRAGKIGIPVGVFSSSALPEKVEGYYSATNSKVLFEEALTAVQNFFNGKHYGSNTTGESLKSYLVDLNAKKDGAGLDAAINSQWESARTFSQSVDANFANQIESDKNKMLGLYDEVQKAVILLKVEMMSAMSISVDYSDADGD